MRDERNRGRVPVGGFLGDSVRAGYTGLRRSAGVVAAMIVGVPCWVAITILSLLTRCL